MLETESISLCRVAFRRVTAFARATACLFHRFLLPVVIAAAFLRPLCAQDLAPRAYLIVPVHSNAVTLSYSFFDGNIILSNAVPITGATGRVNLLVSSYFHSMSFFGHSSSFTYSLPYGIGNFQGQVAGAEAKAYRSGLLAESLEVIQQTSPVILAALEPPNTKDQEPTLAEAS